MSNIHSAVNEWARRCDGSGQQEINEAIMNNYRPTFEVGMSNGLASDLQMVTEIEDSVRQRFLRYI